MPRATATMIGTRIPTGPVDPYPKGQPKGAELRLMKVY